MIRSRRRGTQPAVPETLSNFVMECARSDPSKRRADMTEVVRRLEIDPARNRSAQERNSNVA